MKPSEECRTDGALAQGVEVDLGGGGIDRVPLERNNRRRQRLAVADQANRPGIQIELVGPDEADLERHRVLLRLLADLHRLDELALVAVGGKILVRSGNFTKKRLGPRIGRLVSKTRRHPGLLLGLLFLPGRALLSPYQAN